MLLQAPNPIVEDPQIALRELRSHGIELRLDSSSVFAAGKTNYTQVVLRFHTKRFCSNMSLSCRQEGYREKIRPQIDALKQQLESLSDSHEQEAIAKKILRLLTTRPERAVNDRIAGILRTIGIKAAHSEVEFIAKRFTNKPGVRDLLEFVQQEQRHISDAVSQNNFEKAARHRDDREACKPHGGSIDRLSHSGLWGLLWMAHPGRGPRRGRGARRSASGDRRLSGCHSQRPPSFETQSDSST